MNRRMPYSSLLSLQLIFAFLFALTAILRADAAESRSVDVLDFGAKGDGISVNTEAIQKAVRALHAQGGGRVIFPPGTYMSGTVELLSGVVLHLEKGATILASPNLSDYRRGHWPALILARAQRGIGITGKGEINGNAAALVKHFERIRAQGGSALEFFPEAVAGRKMEFFKPQGDWIEIDPHAMESEGKLKSFVYSFADRPNEAVRPQIVEFKDCRDVVLRDVTLRDAANWVQTYRNCEGMIFSGIKVRSKAYWNNDGLDLVDCRRVEIADCDIDSKDDALCLKSEPYGAGCEDIIIRRVALASNASALKFGTASHVAFRRITATDITVRDTYRSAIAIQTVDGAAVEDILVERLRAKNTGNAIALRLGRRNPARPPGSLQRVVLRDIEVQVPPLPKNYHREIGKPHNLIPSSIVGIPGHPISDVRIENLVIRYGGGADPERARVSLDALDSIPESAGNYPEFSMWGELPSWGLYIRHAVGVTIRRAELFLDAPDFRPAVVADDAPGLMLDSWTLGPGGGQPAVVLKDSPGAKLKDPHFPKEIQPLLTLP
jgi:hypothetical protein